MTTSRQRRLSDPRLQQEKGRYQNPIPSRELILDTLTELAVPATESELARLLEIESQESVFFKRRLSAMVRDGQLLVNRQGAYLLAARLNLVHGKVIGHPDGYGFLSPDEGGADLYIPPHEMAKVMHGDRIIASTAGQSIRRGKMQVRIVEVTEGRKAAIVGRLRMEGELVFLEPADRRIGRPISIRLDKSNIPAREGDVAVVRLENHPDRGRYPVGGLVEVLGHELDPGIEIEVALRKHDLPFEFSAGALRQTARIAPKVQKRDLAERRDIRDLGLITIDGENARDFDDAVWAERAGKGFRLLVAIADVSHYVPDGSALDADARERATSVYFPRRVIPMLPEALSNGICSLNPGEDRLCLCCEMQITQSGRVKHYEFFPAVMHSAARLTYEQAHRVVFTEEGAEPVPEEVRRNLEALKMCYLALRKAREHRGAIDFDTVEVEIAFDSSGKIAGMSPLRRNEAHRLIEECMLAANVCAAEFLGKADHPALYRVHDGPTDEKLGALKEFLHDFGLKLGGGDKPSPSDYAQVLDDIRDIKERNLVQTILLRSLSQARYSPDNSGHFGLAYKQYAHFTSPIRRYPDLLVHRVIKAVLRGERYEPGNWGVLGQHCSDCERRAEDASRDVSGWLKCHFMKDRAGERFSGVISGVASFGVFVTLDDLFVEGMVHVSDLGTDYFVFDPKRHRLQGERTGLQFRIGDSMDVRIARVDVDAQKIELLPDRPGDSARRSDGKGRKRARRQ